MRRVQDPNLADLLYQLRYAPEARRQEQLNAAERLLADIQVGHDYPFDFVYYRITGFHPDVARDHVVIPGAALRVDLQTFISRLSNQSPVPVALQSERVFSIEALAEHLQVSTKTLDRWRSRGLVARRFVFEDGHRRLGFLASSVDRFLAGQPELAERARRFERLSRPERAEIVALARELAAQSRSRHQVIAAITKRTGRAHETVRYTLRDHEARHPEAPLFVSARRPLDARQAAELTDLYRSGTPVRDLMARFHRSRSSIYRIVNRRRAQTLLGRRIHFVPSPEFEDPTRCQTILDEPIDLPGPTHTEPFELLEEQLLPEYLQVLKDTAVLTREQEIQLFRKYNCLKWVAQQTRRRLDRAHPSSTALSTIEATLTEAETLERIIVEANLRLVVSIAGRHSPPGSSHFAELVSKGNYALIKAVQVYDYTQGFRFGKRAALTIAKEYARVSGKATELTPTRAASIATRQQQLRDTVDIAALERARHSLTQVIRQELDARERFIILRHFGLVGSGPRRETLTLKAIGDHLGLTKERVRQIELVALQKLRQCLSSAEFDLLTR